MIPVVPGSEVQIQTPQRGATLDPGAFQLREGAFMIDPGAATAPARASLGAVGERYQGSRAVAGAVGNASGALEGIADDLLKAKRAQIAADADFRMRAAQQSFVESLRGDGNEGSWGERAKETYDRTRDEILESHNVPPGMRRELDASMRSWGQALAIKAGTMAAVQSVNRAEVAIRKSYDEAGRDGDAVGMANAVSLGRSSKLDPVAMDQLEQGIPRALALTAIENGLRTNPQGTHDLLASGGSLPIADQNGVAISPKKVFPAKELAGLQNAARVQAAAWQKGNAEELLQTSADPITGMVPDSTIEHKMAAKEISQAFGRSLIASQARKIKADSAELAKEDAREDREQFSYVTATVRDTTLWEADPDGFEAKVKEGIEAIRDPALRRRAETDANLKIKAVAKTSDTNRYNVLLSRVHDATAWGSVPDQYAKQLVEDAAGISDPVLRQKAINEANHQLTAVKKKGELDERPVERDVYAMIRRDLAERSAMVPTGVSEIPATERGILHPLTATSPARTEYTPIFGGLSALRKMDDVLVEGTFGKGTRKEDVERAAEVHAAQVESQMRAWFKSEEGQKATFDQADAHLRQLERPYVMETVRATLSKRAPATITTEEEFNALPSGARFVFNGRVGTKK